MLKGELIMNKLTLLFTAISSTLLLSGCNVNNNKNKQISEKEFATRLSSAKDITYSNATVHATEHITGTGDFVQERNEERTEVYTHYVDTDAWIVDNGDSLLRRYVYNFGSLESFKDWLEDEELSYSYKYYSDLTVEIKETGTYTDNMMGVSKTVNIDSTMTIKINEFGYLTYLEGSYDQDIVQTSGETTYRGTKSGESMIEVSYK